MWGLWGLVDPTTCRGVCALMPCLRCSCRVQHHDCHDQNSGVGGDNPGHHTIAWSSTFLATLSGFKNHRLPSVYSRTPSGKVFSRERYPAKRNAFHGSPSEGCRARPGQDSDRLQRIHLAPVLLRHHIHHHAPHDRPADGARTAQTVPACGAVCTCQPRKVPAAWASMGCCARLAHLSLCTGLPAC